MQEEDILLICSSRSQSCGSEVFAGEQATLWNFILFLRSQLRQKKSHFQCLRRQLTSLSILRDLSWIPCMVKSWNQSTHCLFLLVQSSAVMFHPQSQIVKGIHPNVSYWASNSAAICFSKYPVQTSVVLLLPDFVVRCQLSCFLRILCSSASNRASTGSCVRMSAVVLPSDLVFRCQLSCLFQILCSRTGYCNPSGSCVQVSAVMLPQDLLFRCQLSCFFRILRLGFSCRAHVRSYVQVSAVVLPPDLVFRCQLS